MTLDVLETLPPDWRAAMEPYLDPEIVAKLNAFMAREYADRTANFAWVQAAGRTRPVLVKILFLAVAMLAATAIIGWLVQWSAGPAAARSLDYDRWYPALFNSAPITEAALAELGFALGLLAGVVIRRVVPAMAVTAAVLITFLAGSYNRLLAGTRDYQDTLDALRRWVGERRFQVGVQLLRRGLDGIQAGGALSDIAEAALAAMSAEFDALYAPGGRESIPPERLLRALLLQAFYSIRSERQLIESAKRPNSIRRVFSR